MEHAIGGLALVTVLGIAGRWLAWGFRLPSIPVVLMSGLAVGTLTGLSTPDPRQQTRWGRSRWQRDR